MQTNDKLYQGMELPRKTSDRPLNAEIIRQTRKKVMDGKDVLVGEHRRSSIFAGYHIFASAGHIERYNGSPDVWQKSFNTLYHDCKVFDTLLG